MNNTAVDDRDDRGVLDLQGSGLAGNGTGL